MCLGLSVFMFSCVSTHSIEPAKLNERQRIYAELTNQKIIVGERKLVKLTHVCDLIINETHYPVINLMEHVLGAQVPRGVNRFLVLDASLQLVREISYDGSSEPLFCNENKLFLFGYLAIDGLGLEGNVISFSENAEEAVASIVEANDFPKQKVPQ